MKSVRNHLSLIIPLVALLLSFEFSILIDRLVKDYERRVNNEYSIILVAENAIEESIFKSKVDVIEKVEEIDSKHVIDKLENDISPSNFALLKVSIPKFYKITLNTFPSENEIKSIEKYLLTIKGIKRVETFSKTHNQIYSLLVVINSLSNMFAITIFAVGFLLMVKQVEVWRFEHLERMEIMALFGAPYWMRSALLFRLAITDSIISAIITIGLYHWFSINETLNVILSGIGFHNLSFDIIGDSIYLFGISLGLSLFAVILVITRQKS